MNNKRIEAQAQALIHEAIGLYCGDDCQPPKSQLSSGNVHELDHQQIVQGVTAMLLQCNISAGSAGDIDLYKLNSLYLRDPEVRQLINGILKDRELWQMPAGLPQPRRLPFS
ncbi:hypothetical protein [Paraburkholderia sp. MM6662-R1]|uniref:hypothetical protein n=1 Tax=Paraburkholderia sp. MM6662-R1 TaxID=2991066 RepID=UPI003D19500F